MTRRGGWKWAPKEQRAAVTWLPTLVERQRWDSGEWWDAQAKAVGGQCEKCGGWLRGVYTVVMDGRVVVAQCLACGQERALLVQGPKGSRPIVPGTPTPEEARKLEAGWRSNSPRIRNRRERRHAGEA